MSWHYSRVDHLDPKATCIFCGRALKSLKGIVISDGAQEAYAGPNCAKKHLGPPEERLLDVARLALLVVSPGDPDSLTPAPDDLPPHSGPKTGNQVAKATAVPIPGIDPVIQYLRLRYEAMSGFRFQKSVWLTEAYSAFQADGELDEFVRKRIAGTIRNAAEQKTVFSMRNIKHCIGFDHWLREAITHTHPDRREFLEAMIAKLHNRWCLTSGQIAGINSWGQGLRKRIDDFPHLDVTSFEGVVVPDFMQPKSKKS